MADIKRTTEGLEHCLARYVDGLCDDCPYMGEIDKSYMVPMKCKEIIMRDALELLKEQPKWIPVSEGLPEEHDTIFAKLKGTDKWRSAMFEKMSDDVRIVVVFPDGTRRVSHSHTVDGKWECEKSPVKRTVTHWMPNPAMPKAGEHE